MANVIIFNDVPPRNLGLADTTYYLRYQTKTAGVYAIASTLRRHGYSVLVVDHCANYTLAGVKKVIADNLDDLLWVGLGTSFFTANMPPAAYYRNEWATSSELYFEDWFKVLTRSQDLIKKNDFLNFKRELIWSNHELNLIAEFCASVNVPFLIGGAWVTTIRNGNLVNLHPNAYIIAGRAEVVTKNITDSLAQNKNAKFLTVADNTTYDNVDFKQNVYQWQHSDNILPTDWLPIQISRGCAFNCSYCNFDRRSTLDSYRSAESIRTELIRNYEQFGVTGYILMDDLYNESKDKVRMLYDNVWSRLPFKPEWSSYMRLDMIWSDSESIELIKASGARIGSFGIETLHDKAGKRVGKGLGKKRILDTLARVKESWKDDVLIHGYFIAGLPEEPEESILSTIEWAGSTPLLDCVSWQPLWITPPEHKKFVIATSPMSKDYEKYGVTWTSDNVWVNTVGVNFPRAVQLSDLGNQARDFFLGGFGEYPEYKGLGWTHQEIVQLKDKRIECTQKLNDDSHIATNRITQQIRKVLKLD